MEFLKEIENGSILIAPNHLKEIILKELGKQERFINIKLMSLEEFVKNYEFDITKGTLFYLTKQKKIPLAVAKIYIENMHYIENKHYSSKRLNELLTLKQELQEQHLLKENPFFRNSLKNRIIIVYGYDFLLKEEEQLFKTLSQNTNVYIKKTPQYPSKPLTVYQFQTIEEEIEYVLQEICSLLSKGIAPNQIKLVGVSEEYQNRIFSLAKLYHVPLYQTRKITLFETAIGKEVLHLIRENQSFETIIKNLEEQNEPDILDQIITIFNSYINITSSTKELEELLIEDLQNTYLKVPKQDQEIEITTLKNNYFQGEDYLFIVGFNTTSFPIVHKDEDFLSDILKEKLGFTTSLEKNKLEKEAFINKLFSISHLTITYKLKTSFDTYYPSMLIEDYQMQEKEGDTDFKIHYSKKYDTLKLTSMLDDYIKYGKKSVLLEKYYHNLKIPYLSYDHTYQRVNIEELHNYMKEKLTLSYSALDRYNHCAFKYYLQDILKITKFEDTLAIKIGNIFHKILSEAFQDSFSLEESYQREMKALTLSKKEEFYLNKLKKELEFIIQTIQEQNRLTGFNNALFEEKIKIPISLALPVTFMGIVDKILWQEKNGIKLVSIIDYKTGSTSFDLNLITYGLSLQLPTYMYLIHNSQKFQNSKICGIYLQKILNPPPNNSRDFQKNKKDALKLRGYTLDEEEILAIWDTTYENSEMIRSLKKTKNGWYHYAKLLSEEEMNKIINLTEEKIKEGAEHILNGEFTINPKRIDGKNIGCEFCSFKDICYQKEQDIIELKKEEREDETK